MSRILCSYRSVRPVYTQQQSCVLRQICTHPSSSQQPTQTLTPLLLHAQSRWSAIKFIFPPQNDNLIYGTRVELRSWLQKKRNHSFTTFNGFIPLPQQCCCPGMAVTCCLVSGWGCFMWMMEASARLVSKGARCVGSESTTCLMVSSCIRYSEDGCMFSGCEKRVVQKCSYLKQNM